jgi:tetratricopeptide (TPR) repeat protein
LRISFTVFLLFFSSCTSLLYSQEKKVDSLETIWKSSQEDEQHKFEALNAYYELINEIAPDSTLLMLDKHYNVAIKEQNNSQLFLITKWIGNINRFKGNLETALKSYHKADSLALILDKPLLKASIKGNLGNVFANQRDYSKSAKYFSEALKIYQENESVSGTVRILTNLGTLHLIIENYKVSEEYYQKALEKLGNIENKKRRFAILKHNIGWSQYKNNQFDEARLSYEEALQLFQEQNRKFLIASSYSTLSLIHKELGNIEKAKEYTRKDYNLNKEINREGLVFNAEVNMALILYETDVNEAINKGEDLLRRMPHNTDIEIQSKLYNLLYKSYKAVNEPSKALKMYELFTVNNDSIQITKNNYAVARATLTKDFELQLFENKLENTKAQKQLEINQLKRTYGIITISIFTIAIFAFLFRKQKINNQQKREALLQEISKLKSDSKSSILTNTVSFKLHRENIENSIGRKLNDTDWSVLTILLEDPVISNKKIAERAFKSVDGIGSSLRRMYDYFKIKETKYKKIALLNDSIKRSKSDY